MGLRLGRDVCFRKIPLEQGRETRAGAVQKFRRDVSEPLCTGELAVSRAWGKKKGVGCHDGWDVRGEGIPEVSGWVTRWREGLCQVRDWVSLANLCIPKA